MRSIELVKAEAQIVNENLDYLKDKSVNYRNMPLEDIILGAKK